MSNFVWGPKLAVAGAALILGLAFAVPAGAAESIKKQCSERYQAAKKANTLKGQTWNEFYKECEARAEGDVSRSGGCTCPAASGNAGTSAGPGSRREAEDERKGNLWTRSGADRSDRLPEGDRSEICEPIAASATAEDLRRPI